MKKFIVDRFEGEKAVLQGENGEQNIIDRASLPKNISEGDVLRFEQESCFLSAEETEKRKDQIKKKMEALFKTDS